MKQYYIYMTTNNTNNKKYIGKHYGELDDSYIGSGTLLKRAIKKYGIENFTKEILFISKNDEENCKMEKYFIDLYDAVQNPYFYNIADGGQGGYTTKGYTDEEKRLTAEKRSKSLLGKNNSNHGRKRTEQERALLSKISREYWTEENKLKRSKEISGKGNPMYGKKHSQESKDKISKAKRESSANKIKISMYDNNNILIKTFNSKKEAMEFLGIKGHTQFNKAIRDKTLYKNYYWREE